MAYQIEIAGEADTAALFIGLYKQMLRIRRFEESLVPLILDGTIKTPCHLCTGQEAIAAGTCRALRPFDFVFGNHRSHGHYLATGGDMKALAAEIYGKVTGCSKGRGGSMHIIDPDAGFMGATPIVAGTVALAVGAALAHKVHGGSRVSAAFFGDGAVNEGIVYESMNFAALNKLPVIFICEDNGYATHMPKAKCTALDRFSALAEIFGIWALKVNGNDAMDVYDQTQYALNKCLNGSGPVFLECQTYRMRGHVGPDDNVQGQHGDIRPADEVNHWAQKDPIKMLYKQLTHSFSHDILLNIAQDVGKEVEEAHEFARSSEWPLPETLFENIYAENG